MCSWWTLCLLLKRNEKCCRFLHNFGTGMKSFISKLPSHFFLNDQNTLFAMDKKTIELLSYLFHFFYRALLSLLFFFFLFFFLISCLSSSILLFFFYNQLGWILLCQWCAKHEEEINTSISLYIKHFSRQFSSNSYIPWFLLTPILR